MDFAMLLGGFAISICQAMDAEGTKVFIKSLDEMAERPTVSAAEAHIYAYRHSGRRGVIENFLIGFNERGKRARERISHCRSLNGDRFGRTQ